MHQRSHCLKVLNLKTLSLPNLMVKKRIQRICLKHKNTKMKGLFVINLHPFNPKHHILRFKEIRLLLSALKSQKNTQYLKIPHTENNNKSIKTSTRNSR